MDKLEPEKILRQIPDFKDAAQSVSRGIHDIVLEGGKPTRKVADLLHGTWLGHPLHPVLTDIVVGAWGFGAVFDLMSLNSKSRSAEKAADTLTTIGTLAAIPTAVAGIADYSTITRRAMATGGGHGLINGIALVLYILSMWARKAGNRGLGLFFSGMGISLATVSAWLGGELVYKYGVGVNKSIQPTEPEDWIAVLDEIELREREPRRVKVKDQEVLLYRQAGAIYAIGAVCAHEGGPLDQGSFEDLCVECPWHQSVFDLRDGSVVHGPSTYAVPGYETRIRNGKLELRLQQRMLQGAPGMQTAI